MPRRPREESDPDLVVLSHLRWCWVWQRPQHLVSRLARRRAAAGARTWFVEEPTTGDIAAPRLEHEERDGIVRVWLVIPADGRAPDAHVGFGGDGAEKYDELLAALLAEHGRPPAPVGTDHRNVTLTAA
jgi:hypothetical protein